MFDLANPHQSRKLIKDTLAEFLAELDQVGEDQPRLVILSKPGVQLVMLHGTKAQSGQVEGPTADRPLTVEMAKALGIIQPTKPAQDLRDPINSGPKPPAREEKQPEPVRSHNPEIPSRPEPAKPVPEIQPGQVEHFTYRGWQIQLQKANEPGLWRYLVRNGGQAWQSQRAMTRPETTAEIRARIDATIAEAAARSPAPPAPESAEARAEAARGGSRYLCFVCQKRTHKPLECYAGRDFALPVPEAYLCPTCRNTQRQKVTDQQAGRTRGNSPGGAQAPSQPLPPQPAPQSPPQAPPVRQEEGQPDTSAFELPEVGAEDPIFSADMF